MMLRVALFAATLGLALGQSEECRKVQYQLCGTTRTHPEECIHCLGSNWNKTAAVCSIGDDEKFCQVTPAEVKCIDALEKVCGPASGHHPDPTVCNACVKAHEEEFKKDNCTASWAYEFCHPHPAPPGPTPSDGCRRAQYAACGSQREIPEYCMKCISVHWNETGAAGCTIPQDEAFCKVTPAEVKCIDALETSCGVRHPLGAECEKCVKEHATTIRGAGCTDPWVEEYCNPKME